MNNFLINDEGHIGGENNNNNDNNDNNIKNNNENNIEQKTDHLNLEKSNNGKNKNTRTPNYLKTAADTLKSAASNLVVNSLDSVAPGSKQILTSLSDKIIPMIESKEEEKITKKQPFFQYFDDILSGVFKSLSKQPVMLDEMKATSIQKIGMLLQCLVLNLNH